MADQPSLGYARDDSREVITVKVYLGASVSEEELLRRREQAERRRKNTERVKNAFRPVWKSLKRRCKSANFREGVSESFLELSEDERARILQALLWDKERHGEDEGSSEWSEASSSESDSEEVELQQQQQQRPPSKKEHRDSNSNSNEQQQQQQTE